MSSANPVPFSHCFRRDSVESICTRCFSTVARTGHETDLEHFERDHTCDPVMIKLLEGGIESVSHFGK
jgi:hypothetical protein